jgi:hypothetical protein
MAAITRQQRSMAYRVNGARLYMVVTWRNGAGVAKKQRSWRNVESNIGMASTLAMA